MLKQRKMSLEQYDIRLATFIAGYFFVQAMNLLVKMILGGIPGWEIISKGVLIVLLVAALPAVVNRSVATAFFAEAIVLIAFVITVLRGTADLTQLRGIIFNALFVYLPMGICTYNICNREILLKRLYQWAWPTQMVLLFVMLRFSHVSDEEYSMSCGYALLLQLLVVFDHYIETKKLHDLAAVLVDCSVIIFFGSRGPVFCVGAFFVLKMAFMSHLSISKRATMAVVGLGGALLLYTFRVELATRLQLLLRNVGYTSRSLQMIINQSFILHDSNREIIFQQCLDNLRERPFLGWGIAGGWNDAVYPHNLVLEMLLSFGIPLGILFLVKVFAMVFRGMRQKDGPSQRCAHILAADFVSLFASGSFIMSPIFFMCLAVCSVKRYRKNWTLERASGQGDQKKEERNQTQSETKTAI